MWRHLLNYRIFEYKGLTVIIDDYGGKGNPQMMFPLSEEGVTSEICAMIPEIAELAGVRSLSPLTAEMARTFEIMFPESDAVPNRDLFDYVYLSSDLTELAGRKFHQKRNHISSFTSSYPYKFEVIDEKNLPILKEAAETMYAISGGDLADEYLAIREVIDNFEALELRAAILSVNGNIVAYTIGEKVNDDTAIIHIEKANRKYPGAYATINNMFAKSQFANVTYINREEDMGIEGLRKAKMSYNPHHFNEAYVIKFK